MAFFKPVAFSLHKKVLAEWVWKRSSLKIQLSVKKWILKNWTAESELFGIMDKDTWVHS